MKLLSVLLRTITYASLFIALVLVYLPARVASLGREQLTAPASVSQMIGAGLSACGAVLAAWCIATFFTKGRGTPFPSDPPRRLVITGPYHFVRNPMYLGAFISLSGAALWFHSWPLFAYAIVFVTATHVFVVLYEEPTLGRSFGDAYFAYRGRTGRWLPKIAALFSRTTR